MNFLKLLNRMRGCGFIESGYIDGLELDYFSIGMDVEIGEGNWLSVEILSLFVLDEKMVFD